jgi:hypothetical protein
MRDIQIIFESRMKFYLELCLDEVMDMNRAGKTPD